MVKILTADLLDMDEICPWRSRNGSKINHGAAGSALRSGRARVAAKGAGFVAPHPARRLARRARFSLVRSCPQRVAARVLHDLEAAPSDR